MAKQRGGVVRLAPGDRERIERIGEKVAKRLAIQGTPVRAVRAVDVLSVALETYEALVDGTMVAMAPGELRAKALEFLVSGIADAFDTVGVDAQIAGDPSTNMIRIDHNHEGLPPSATMKMPPFLPALEGRTLQ